VPLAGQKYPPYRLLTFRLRRVSNSRIEFSQGRDPLAKPLPPLDLLIGFEAAARQLSFSKAADEVCVTQSAISRQVKKLEAFIGEPLFERHHRALQLTEKGRILYDVASQTLVTLARAVEDLRVDKYRRSVKISTTTSFASLWLVPRLANFRDAHPDIAVYLEADNRVVDLKQGSVDLAIRYCTPDQVKFMDATCLSTETIFPVCSPELLRRSGRCINRVEDLQHHALLHLSDAQQAWPWLQWSHWLSQIGSTAPVADIGLRFSHYDQLVHAATMGHGIALGSSPLVDHLLAEGMLVAPLAQRAQSPRAFFICQGTRPNSAVSALVTWLSLTAGASHGRT
jgi:LysR family glycine cleavage system transcriptional activator